MYRHAREGRHPQLVRRGLPPNFTLTKVEQEQQPYCRINSLSFIHFA